MPYLGFVAVVPCSAAAAFGELLPDGLRRQFTDFAAEHNGHPGRLELEGENTSYTVVMAQSRTTMVVACEYTGPSAGFAADQDNAHKSGAGQTLPIVEGMIEQQLRALAAGN